jgi:hypothetical protein
LTCAGFFITAQAAPVTNIGMTYADKISCWQSEIKHPKIFHLQGIAICHNDDIIIVRRRQVVSQKID